MTPQSITDLWLDQYCVWLESAAAAAAEAARSQEPPLWTSGPQLHRGRAGPQSADRLHLLPPLLEPLPGCGLAFTSWPGVCDLSAGWLAGPQVMSQFRLGVRNKESKSTYVRLKCLLCSCSALSSSTKGCSWTSAIHTWMVKERGQKKEELGGPPCHFHSDANSAETLKPCYSFETGRAPAQTFF